jgi:hypothetical protein
MNYSPQDLQQGSRLKKQSEETPSSFGTVDGATERSESAGFGKSRMAGETGARIIQLMNDPVEAQRTMNWMSQFGLSNEGFQFNQAKMMMAGGGQPAEQQESQ